MRLNVWGAALSGTEQNKNDLTFCSLSLHDESYLAKLQKAYQCGGRIQCAVMKGSFGMGFV